ncbi:MAG: chemotaxis protein CheC [Clostridiaceae bacterium]
MPYKKLTPLQLDALREVVSIGSGNAATALSRLLNMKIDMTVPSVEVMPFNDIFTGSGGDEIVVSVIVRVLGDIPGSILLVFKKEEALYIIEMLTGKKYEYLTEYGYSVISEVGNIIASTFVNSINQFTGLKVSPSVPSVTYDMLGGVLSNAFIESGQFDDTVIGIKTVFLQNITKICGHFYYIPMPGSLKKILIKLGLN